MPPAIPSARPLVLSAGAESRARIGRWAVRSVATPARVAVTALVVYAALATVLVASHGVDSLANVGQQMAAHSSVSPTINSHLHPGTVTGYDGQFFYAMALDPARAYHYADAPNYRYSHILYPMLARAVAFGQADWVAAALILVNLLAIALGTFCVAALLARRGMPPAFAALYFLFPGLLVSFAFDLSEPLAYGLAALGLLLLSGWLSPRRIGVAAFAFSLAALARESTLLIAAVVAVVYVLGAPRDISRFRRAAAFGAIAAGPYLIWRVILNAWLGSASSHPGSTVGLLPFSGLTRALAQGPTAPDAWPIIGVAIPATALALHCLLRLRAEWRNETFVALCLSLLLLAFYLPEESYVSYDSAGRLQTGAVLLAVVSLGSLKAKRAFGDRLAGPLLAACATFAYLPLIPMLLTLVRSGSA